MIDETQPAAPRNPRARRRVDAEGVLRDFGRRGRVRVAILRAPGFTPQNACLWSVCGPGARLCDLRRMFAWPYSCGHIWPGRVALARGGEPGQRGRRHRDLPMGDFLDAVADALSLPRPPRVGRREAEQISPDPDVVPAGISAHNRRVKDELGLRLAFPPSPPS